MKLFYALLLITLFTSTLSSESFEDFKNGGDSSMKEFEAFKKKELSEFEKYKKEIDAAYSSYKKELGVFWEKPELSTKKDWVSYSGDKKTKTKVDFKNNVIVIETIATSKKEAEAKLKTALARSITIDTKKAVESDALQSKIYKISKKASHSVKNSKVNTQPILAPVVFSAKPSKKSVKKYVNNKVKKEEIKTKPSKIHTAKVYSVSVALPKNTTLKRSAVFEAEVRKNAKRFDLPVPLIFAIMHTESDFNPFAKSHIPAFGLMQIVPRSAGVDSNNFLYKSKARPSSSYLYNSNNNIEMGSAYLHIVYYRYLRSIKDPTSRLYCTIAAYNTGSGNIAYAFTGKYNMKKAAPKINAMSSDQVYAKLMKDLRFDEPKHYLKRVKKRMNSYKNAYMVQR